jgi:hypothetical protein
MRQLLLAAGAVCAAAGAACWAAGEANTVMPGQAVGTGFNFNSVGTQFQPAGSKVGQPLNVPADTPMMRRADPKNPFDGFRGTNLDPKSIVAPVPGVGDQNALERLYNRMKSAVGLAPKPSLAPAQNVTPGIFRRNRERTKEAKDQMWRRD